MSLTKKFRLNLFEKEGYIIIQRRFCFIWITLYDENNEVMQFKNVLQAEEHLHKEKRPSDKYIIDYRKTIN